MGYNTWNDLRCGEVSEARVLEAADRLISLGLADAGYEYVNLDDCWQRANVDAAGELVPNVTAFPRGMLALSRELHAKGLKFGLYADRGYKTCAFRAGSRGRETAHARQFAAWEIDYLKYDSCFAPNVRRRGALDDYARMRDALNATGRDVLFSICGWSAWYAESGFELGHSWRVNADCDEWANVYQAARVTQGLARYARAGGFNDPDMLLGSSHSAAARLEPRQSRAQFALWCVATAPLLIGSPLRSLTRFDLETYANRDLVAVNQDALAVQGVVVESDCPPFTPRDNWWCSPWSMPADVVQDWRRGLGRIVGCAVALAVVLRRRALRFFLLAVAVAALLYSRVLAAYRPTVDACAQVWAKPLQAWPASSMSEDHDLPAAYRYAPPTALVLVNFDPENTRDVACDSTCLAKATRLTDCLFRRRPDEDTADRWRTCVALFLTAANDDDDDDDDENNVPKRADDERLVGYRVRDLHAHSERDLLLEDNDAHHHTLRLEAHLHADGDAAAFAVRPLVPR